jgi:hypothetical protein
MIVKFASFIYTVKFIMLTSTLRYFTMVTTLSNKVIALSDDDGENFNPYFTQKSVKLFLSRV